MDDALSDKISTVRSALTVTDPVTQAAADLLEELGGRILALEGELARAKAEEKSWFDAFSECRDSGSPSWDLFDTTVGAAVTGIIQMRVGVAEDPNPDLIKAIDMALDSLPYPFWHQRGAAAVAAIAATVVAGELGKEI